jgi:uncharacterized membrane protein
MDVYIVLKWLHMVGAATLFGVGVGTAFHFLVAARSGNVTAIAAAAHAMVLADFIFILPAGVLQPATGVAMALISGYPMRATWIVASAILYAVVLACWIPVVFIQLRIRRIALRSAAEGAPLGADYARLFRRWFILGWPAFLAMLGIFGLMVARPA